MTLESDEGAFGVRGVASAEN